MFGLKFFFHQPHSSDDPTILSGEKYANNHPKSIRYLTKSLDIILNVDKNQNVINSMELKQQNKKMIKVDYRKTFNQNVFKSDKIELANPKISHGITNNSPSTGKDYTEQQYTMNKNNNRFRHLSPNGGQNNPTQVCCFVFPYFHSESKINSMISLKKNQF